MGWRAYVHSINGVPLENLVAWASTIPQVRDKVIAALQASGHLEAVGLRRVPWYRRKRVAPDAAPTAAPPPVPTMPVP